MLSLIKKDFLVAFSSKGNILFLTLYIPLIYIVLGTSGPERMISIMIMSFAYILTTISFAYEVTTKPHILIQSLPIKKRDVVISKYISIFVNYIGAIIFIGGYLWIISLFGIRTVDSFSFSLIINTLPILVISLSISLPAQFRLPARIANFVNSFIIIIVINRMMFVSSGGKSMFDVYMAGDLKSLIITVIVYLASMTVSIWMYEGRDLI